MVAKIIDGRNLAKLQRQQLMEQVEISVRQYGTIPSLHVILVGDHAASQIYVRNKQKACQVVGIESVLHQLSSTVTQSQVVALIEELNQNSCVNGILLQLPLPSNLNSQEILERINPLKDVDGLHPYNLGRLLMNMPLLAPCTPQGCLQLIKTVYNNIDGKNIVVVGRSILVGRTLAALLTNKNATVTLAHSKTINLKEVCQSAEILIAAVGSPEFITGDYIKPGAVVIDVGINRIDTDDGTVLKGDVHAPSVQEVAGYLTPVPGGVGPMTISNLLLNTIKAVELQKNRPFFSL
jgi:methylenetetrahydrofolate dehydrogenase (NADP+)/methenyltetrahydrofolate cyclohydrolase